MSVRVAINGFGRIGRLVLRAILESGRTDIEVVGINDLGPVETNAHLLRYDTVHGKFPGEVKTKEGAIDAGRGWMKVTAERDPSKLPWAELKVDVALECTGIFTDKEKAAAHLKAGAKRVLISAPATNADLTVVYGVNHTRLEKGHTIVSNASCTTNCLAPVAQVLHKAFGIEHGFMTTVHSYTGDQMLVDGPHKDLRRARAAAVNIVPTGTGAARATALVIESMKGRLDGTSLRVPIPVGSITDFVGVLSRDVTVDEVNEAYRAAAATERLDGVLVYSEAPLVSSDIVGSPASCTFDAPLTMALGNLVKVFGWYDNEWGYSNRLVDLAALVGAAAK
jgi:glyceraldehyde 3-phosphate dehydrogenase